jgi:LuxR family maltose regulon positive regulatory protein
MRARGQMTEIRQRDLQFTAQETANFWHAVGLDLATADVAVLEERTEGWIAGLQLAALSMRGRDAQGTAQFIRGFSGRHAFVLDYLTDEVLQRQPKPIQQFLLQTSILERMCGALCDAVVVEGEKGEGARATDLSSGQAILEYLDRANLFVVPLDDERQWYRYHHLFRELLRARLQASSPPVSPPLGGTEIIRALHRRATTWCDQNRLPADAVHHALAAQDYDTAADIVERAIQRVSVWSRLNVATFMGWFNALPDDIARARPRLQLFASRVHYVTGQPEKANRILQDITAYLQDNPDTPDAENIRDRVAADRASYAAVEGDIDEAIALARQILQRLPTAHEPMHLRVASVLGMAHMRAGDLDKAERAFTDAVEGAKALGIAIAAAPLVCNLADIQFIRGRLRQAAETCEQATQMGTVDGAPISATGYAGIEMGKILYEQNDLPSAERHVSEGLERLAQAGTPDSFGTGHVVLARIKQAQGDGQAALEAIAYAVRVAQDSRISRAIHLMSAHRARIWLAQGELEQAVRWADEYRQVGETAYLREVEDLTLARILLAQGKPAEALALLDGLLTPAEAGGRLGRVIELQALRAVALDALGDEAVALDALARALTLAEPEGYVRVFVDQGEPVEKLLWATRRQTSGVKGEYVRELLAAFAAEATRLEIDTTAAGPPSSVVARQPLLEPLTDREMEVLGLLAEGLTNPEIGQRLVISLPTVKTHARNIYGKLGVHGRREAVREARALGILPRI